MLTIEVPNCAKADKVNVFNVAKIISSKLLKKFVFEGHVSRTGMHCCLDELCLFENFNS